MNDSEKVREYAGRLLRKRISVLSEELYCAGWCHGIEYILWEKMTCPRGGRRAGSRSQISSRDIEELRQLSLDAGGWFAWDDREHDARFVPMSEWLGMYEKHAKRTTTKESSNDRLFDYITGNGC